MGETLLVWVQELSFCLCSVCIAPVCISSLAETSESSSVFVTTPPLTLPFHLRGQREAEVVAAPSAADPPGRFFLPSSFSELIPALGCASGICRDVSPVSDLKQKISPFFLIYERLEPRLWSSGRALTSPSKRQLIQFLCRYLFIFFLRATEGCFIKIHQR